MPEKTDENISLPVHMFLAVTGIALGAISLAIGIWLYMLEGPYINPRGIIFSVVSGLWGIIFCAIGAALAKRRGGAGLSLVMSITGLFGSLVSVYLQWSNMMFYSYTFRSM